MTAPPCQDLGMIRFNELTGTTDLLRFHIDRPIKRDRLKPKLGLAVTALDVHMRRLSDVGTIKSETATVLDQRRGRHVPVALSQRVARHVYSIAIHYSAVKFRG